jgi:hypothetical protein
MAIAAATRRNVGLTTSPSPRSSGFFVRLLSNFQRIVLRPVNVTDCVVVGVIDFRPMFVRLSFVVRSISIRRSFDFRSTFV